MKYCHNQKAIAVLLMVFFFCLSAAAQETMTKEEVSRLIGEAAVNLKEGKLDEAIEKTSRILEAYPKSGDVYVIRALAYMTKREKEKSIEDFTRALTLRIDPSMELLSHKMRGLLYHNLQKYAEAIKDLDFAISKDPTDFKDYAFRGWSHFQSGNFNLAIADFNSVLKLKPTESSFHLGLAKSYYFLENYEKTVEEVTEELKMNPNPSVENYLFRSNAYRKMGQDELAEIDEKKYIALGGKSTNFAIVKPKSAVENKTYYDEPRVKAMRKSIYQSIAEKNFDAAFKEVEELIQNVPNKENINIKSLIYVFRGGVFFQKGEFQKALNDLNIALELDEKSYQAYQGRAATHRKLGMIKEAEADEAKYLELKPKEK